MSELFWWLLGAFGWLFFMALVLLFLRGASPLHEED